MFPGSASLTHTVEVLYYNHSSKKAKTTMVDIRRLSLITELSDDVTEASAALLTVI